MSSTFYLVSSRVDLGERLVNYLASLFPGLQPQGYSVDDWADVLAELAEKNPNVFVIYREDLEDEDLEEALIDLYGADEGDLVVEVPSQKQEQEVAAKLWRVGPTTTGSEDLPAAA